MRRMITRARARAILFAWRMERRWVDRHRRRWLRHYAQAIHWHSGYDPIIAREMALEALAADPAALRRDPTLAALTAIGIPEEALI